MSALNLSWLPEDADTREQEAEECWPVTKSGIYLGPWPPPEAIEHAGTGSADDDWPPREPDDDAWQAPAPKHPKHLKHQPSVPMQCLQRVLDDCTDDQARMLRARGCDLMPKRWNGVEPA